MRIARGARTLKPRKDTVATSRFCMASKRTAAANRTMTVRWIQRMAASSCGVERRTANPGSVLARSSTRSQAEANSDPTCSRKYEIDAKEEAQNVEAGYRPMCENHDAK